MVYPVVHALRESAPYKDGQIGIHVLGLPAATSILKENGIDPIGFADYLDKEKDADALTWGRKLAEDNHSPTMGIDIEDSIAYLGLCYKDMVVRLGEQETARLFKDRGRQAFYPLSIMERIFDDIKPDFVIATNSPRAEAAAIEIANRRGIDNMQMTDLFARIVLCSLNAKNVTFINKQAKTMLVEEGLLTEGGKQFYYTGNPAFDKILALPTAKDPAWIKQHFPKAEGKKIILHTDTPGYWNYFKKYSHVRSPQEILEELDRCYQAAMENGAAYLIRPHPSQNRALFEGWLKGKRDAFLAADCNLHELLRNVDLLLARITTVTIEAIYMGKRVLQLDCDFHVDMPLTEMGVAWGVTRHGDLADEIRNALSDDKKLKEINTQAKQLFPGEPASPKIANILIDKLVSYQDNASLVLGRV